MKPQTMQKAKVVVAVIQRIGDVIKMRMKRHG